MNKEKIKEKLLNDTDKLKKVTSVLTDTYNELCYFLKVYNNNEKFFNEFYKNKLYELVIAISQGDYNLSDEYVKIDYELGCINSYTEYEYIKLLYNYIDDIVECIIKHKNDTTIKNELKEVL